MAAPLPSQPGEGESASAQSVTGCCLRDVGRFDVFLSVYPYCMRRRRKGRGITPSPKFRFRATFSLPSFSRSTCSTHLLCMRIRPPRVRPSAEICRMLRDSAQDLSALSLAPPASSPPLNANCEVNLLSLAPLLLLLPRPQYLN